MKLMSKSISLSYYYYNMEDLILLFKSISTSGHSNIMPSGSHDDWQAHGSIESYTKLKKGEV